MLCQHNYVVSISTLGVCGGLLRTDFGKFFFRRVCIFLKGLILGNLGGCGSLERSDFQSLPFWEDVVALKGLIFDNV